MSRFVVGLVGGVASGKSTVARILAGERGAAHVDADALARRVFRRPAVQRALRRRFPGARGRDGSMDRIELARRVFSSRRALAALEAITHPPIRRAIEAAIRRARARIVVLDAALLQETGADGLCDEVWYVACPARERRRRAREGRGWSAAEHRAREARQWPCRRKRARAQQVIDNGGDPGRTRRETLRALDGIERRF